MKNKIIIISALSIVLILSGCNSSQEKSIDTPELSDITIPNEFVEEFTQEDIANSHSNYSVMFPQPYTIEMYPGESRTETIKIENVGKKGDTFIFETEYRREENQWADFSTLPEATYLKSGKSMKLHFTIIIPEEVEIGSTTSFTIAAKRKLNNEIVGGTNIAIKIVDKE